MSELQETIDKLTKELHSKDIIISELQNSSYRMRENVIEEQERVRKLRDMVNEINKEFRNEEEFKQEIKKLTADIVCKDATIASLREQLQLFTEEIVGKKLIKDVEVELRELIEKMNTDLLQEKVKREEVEKELRKLIRDNSDLHTLKRFKLERELRCLFDERFHM